MEVVLGLLLLLVLLLLAGVILLYNRLVGLRQRARSAWSDIDVQMQRRYDLVPGLVETVKGYAGHERDTLESVIRARSEAKANHGTPAQQAKSEDVLSGALRQLFALAEQYPELKADANFMQLQSQLAGLEEEIQFSRRYYNGSVRELNTTVEQFPSNLVANWFGFTQAEYFEPDVATAADVRSAPKVQF